MSFFEPPPESPLPDEPQREPEWLGPAENVLPAPFPLWAVLARTGDVALAVRDGLAYPNGFTFGFSLRRRAPRSGPGDDPIHHWHGVRGGEIPPEALRLGVQLADGSKATIFDGHRWFATADRPDGPVLVQRGGSGGMHSWELAFWVWPLPPPGPLAGRSAGRDPLARRGLVRQQRHGVQRARRLIRFSSDTLGVLFRPGSAEGMR